MSISFCYYYFKTLNMLSAALFDVAIIFLLIPVTPAVQTQPSLTGFHYLQRSLRSYTGWEVGGVWGGGVFPPSVNALLLGPNAAGSEEAQFAPVLKFYTHFNHNRKSCECNTDLSTSTCQVYLVVLVYVLGKQICVQQMVATFFMKQLFLENETLCLHKIPCRNKGGRKLFEHLSCPGRWLFHPIILVYWSRDSIAGQTPCLYSDAGN